MTLPDLRDFGVRHMTDKEIQGFLASQGVGILGLPTDVAPSLRPMSFAFDGGMIYLYFVDGDDSRKGRLVNETDAATFLVYSVETPFNWRSVLLTGPIEAVREADQAAKRENLSFDWRPAIFEQAEGAVKTTLYELEIETQVGVKHLGLPDGLREESPI